MATEGFFYAQLCHRAQSGCIFVYFAYLKNSRTYTVDEATTRLEGYCTYQDRCHQEVERKLREMRMIPEAREKIIMHLIQQDYLNETRFARSFARGKFKTKKWGKHRILRELKMRNISAFNLKIALKEIDEADYLATFHELAEKRWEQLSTERSLQKKKKKFADYLLYRGWESNLIWEKVTELTFSR